MKKAISVLLLAALALTLLCACGGEKTDVIYFQNDIGEKVPGFYVSSTEDQSWGDPLNLATVSVGGKITIDLDKLPSGSGVVYDIGAVDETGMLYEFYEIPITIGDTIAISSAGDGENAYLKITGTDGQITEYQGVYYSIEDDAE